MIKVCAPGTWKLSHSLFTHWAESKYTLPLQICLGLPGMSGATFLLHRHHSPSRMFSEFLLRKGPLQMTSFSPLFPCGTLWIGYHPLNAPQWSAGQSPSFSAGLSHQNTGLSSSRLNMKCRQSLCCRWSGGWALAKSWMFTPSNSPE